MGVSISELNYSLEKYNVIDTTLITTKDFIRSFGQDIDYIEAHLYTQNNTLIKSDYNFTYYTVPGTLQGETETTSKQIEFKTEEYLKYLGYYLGSYKVQYNIFRKKIFNTNEKLFFVKEISQDRKEIRISTNDISNSDIESGVLNFIQEYQSSPYFKDFNLNFGDNNIVNAVNIILDKNTNPYSILVKLYNPLPSEFDLKSSLWFVEELSDPHLFQIDIFPDVVEEKIPFLRNANFDIDVEKNSIKPTEYINSQNILTNSTLSGYQKLLNVTNTTGIKINTDYSLYENFVHFSSAKQRLLNFFYKLQNIENNQSSINSIKNINNYTISFNVSSSIYTLQAKINDIIKNFDGYENYLYFSSGSKCWPKSGSYGYYTNYPTTSSISKTWLGSDDYNSIYYGGQLFTASYYDQNNQNNLINIVPEYIKEDDINFSYVLFCNMVGQHFDDIWLYIKSVTDLYKNTNSLSTGISKDVVYYALKSLGMDTYNSKSDDDIYNYLLGINPNGSILPLTGSNQTLVSSSNESMSGEDIQKELLKRLWHNISHIFKSRGTEKGIDALITTYGIPDSILSTNEYGGTDKTSAVIEYVYERFSYALANTTSSFVRIPWFALYQNGLKGAGSDVVPDAIEFRFKPAKNLMPYSASLLDLMSPGATTSSFSLYFQPNTTRRYPYADVIFRLSGSSGYYTSSLTLPIYSTQSNGETYWWNVLLKRRTQKNSTSNNDAQYYDLFVKNKIEGRIGHQASGSIYVPVNSSSYNYSWTRYTNYPELYLGGFRNRFSGSFQEFRYWSYPISESSFNFHVLNPESIESYSTSSTYDDLAARYPLGNNLYTYRHSNVLIVSSIAPSNINPIYVNTLLDEKDMFFGFTGSNNYVANVEEYYTNTPNAAYSTPVTEKIRIIDNIITGSLLSPFIKMEKKSIDPLTKDIHFVDVSFSPQNEINKDIIAHFGNKADLDEFLGDPKNDYKNEYSLLKNLNVEYYKKYTKRYNYKDYVELVKSFDNSLFKMIKDNVPARSNVQTGLTIKQPILERSKIKRTETKAESIQYKNDKIKVGKISIDSTYKSNYSDGKDFYNGELKNSLIDVNNYFEKNNYNPYIVYIENLNVNNFEHTDYNTLINNVSLGQLSRINKVINNYNTNILEDAYLQDWYRTYQRHIRPRYLGSKTYSATYNFYTQGDYSYGKTAAIDKNTLKFAWIKNIAKKNLNFFDKTSLNLKYLVDSESSLLELSKNNSNLFEVQNIFKSGKTSIISLTDPLSPTNQTSLNGNKIIWRGGFSFDPILYRELNETLYFKYDTPIQTLVVPLGIKAYSNNSYQYAYLANQNNATPPTSPALNASGDGYYYYINNSTSNTTSKAMADNSYTTSTWRYNNKSSVSINPTTITFTTAGGANPQTLSGRNSKVYGFNLLNFNDTTSGFNTEPDINTYRPYITSSNYYYVAPRTGKYNIEGNIKMSFRGHDEGAAGTAGLRIVGIFEYCPNSGNPLDEDQWVYIANTTLAPLNGVGHGSLPGNFGYNSAESAIFYDRSMISEFIFQLQYTGVTPVLLQGSNVRFKLYWCDINGAYNNSNYVSWYVYPQSYFQITDTTATVNKYIYERSYGQDSPFYTKGTTYISNDTLIFNSETTQFFNLSKFKPYSSTSGSYTDVVDYMSVQPNDIIRIGPFESAASQLYEVKEVSLIAGSYYIVLDRTISDINYDDAQNFAILRPKPDETSIILDYNKTAGETTTGVIMCEDLLPIIKSDVSNIIKPLKTDLL